VKLWDKLYRLQTYTPRFPSANAQAFLAHHVKVEDQSTKRLLDHGCGNGRHAFFFDDVGLKVTAVDSSESALSLLKAEDISNKIDTRLAAYESLPFEDEYFDYVFSEGVLYYGTRDTFSLGVKEIKRCLKKGGVARIYTKTDKDYWTEFGDDLGQGVRKAKNHQFENDMLIYCASYEDIISHMCGFSEVAIGIEEFNFVGLSHRKSFWVITAIK
jgi:SAM-dependent methyltransferase